MSYSLVNMVVRGMCTAKSFPLDNSVINFSIF